MYKIKYPEEKLANGDTCLKDIEINEKGQLIFSQADIGPADKSVVGADSDYEYSSTVAPENVDRVTLELIRDRFKDHGEFEAWLKEKNIPSEFWSY